jgi:hypothetical protein
MLGSARSEDSLLLVERDGTTAIPVMEEGDALQAAVAAGTRTEVETSPVHTADVEVLFPPDVALLVVEEKAQSRPEAETPPGLPIATAAPQSEADTREEHDGAGVEQNDPIETSSQVSNDPLHSTKTFAGPEEPTALDHPTQMKAQNIAPETEAAETVLPPPDASGEQAGLSTDGVNSNEGDSGEEKHLYQPPSQRSPRRTTTRSVGQSSTRATSDLALDVRVRLRFDRFNFCEIRLLPEHTAEMDNEVEVKTGGAALHLVAQEEWYEDLPFENIGDLLRRGMRSLGHRMEED